MDKLPENIKKQLPENFSEEWELIDVKDIKPNDYIAYFPKKRKYESIDDTTKEKMTKGGFVSFIPNDDVKEIKKQSMNVIGFRQFNKKWSVGVDNVYFFAKTKKDVQAILNKGKEKANTSRAETRKRKLKVETENLKEDIETAQKMEKKKKITQAVLDASAAIDEELEAEPERFRKPNAPAKRRLLSKVEKTSELQQSEEPTEEPTKESVRNPFTPAKRKLEFKEPIIEEKSTPIVPTENEKRGRGRPPKFPKN